MKRYRFIGDKNIINASGIARKTRKSRQWIWCVLSGKENATEKTAFIITKAVNVNAKIEDFFEEVKPQC